MSQWTLIAFEFKLSFIFPDNLELSDVKRPNRLNLGIDTRVVGLPPAALLPHTVHKIRFGQCHLYFFVFLSNGIFAHDQHKVNEARFDSNLQKKYCIFKHFRSNIELFSNNFRLILGSFWLFSSFSSIQTSSDWAEFYIILAKF